MTQSTGKHVIIDFYSCYEDPISTQHSLTEILKNALEDINFTPINALSEEFSKEHVIFTIADNCHLTLHAYPDLGYVALDLYTFNKTINVSSIMKYLKDAFGAERVKMTSVNRADYGQLFDMKPRSKTKTTAKAKVKRTGKKMKNASSKVFKIIRRKKKK